AELLAQRVQGRDRRGAPLVGEEVDVVAGLRRRPEAYDRLGLEPSLLDHALQHRLRVVEQSPRRRSLFRIVEQSGIAALELPGLEERRPVDEAGKVGEIVPFERARAEVSRRRRAI